MPISASNLRICRPTIRMAQKNRFIFTPPGRWAKHVTLSQLCTRPQRIFITGGHANIRRHFNEYFSRGKSSERDNTILEITIRRLLYSIDRREKLRPGWHNLRESSEWKAQRKRERERNFRTARYLVIHFSSLCRGKVWKTSYIQLTISFYPLRYR